MSKSSQRTLSASDCLSIDDFRWCLPKVLAALEHEYLGKAGESLIFHDRGPLMTKIFAATKVCRKGDAHGVRRLVVDTHRHLLVVAGATDCTKTWEALRSIPRKEVVAAAASFFCLMR